MSGYTIIFINRTQTIEEARAAAEKIKLIGMAEADAIAAVGNAEADRMKMKANVYKKYGQAATMSMVLDALPKVFFFFLILMIIFVQ